MDEVTKTVPIGLSSDEATHRLTEYGPNSLPEKPPKSIPVRLLKQLASPLIYILLFALAVDLIIWFSQEGPGYPIESLAIAIILSINAMLGVFQEGKAEAALVKLKAMATPRAWVMRDGRLCHLDASLIVPGDVVRVEGGDRIPADGVLVSDESLQIDESILTGESFPQERGRGDEVLSGTLLQRGLAYIEITRTGELSTMGRLAMMIGGIQQGKTPLEEKLGVFAKQISKLVLGIAGLVLVAGTLVQGVAEFDHVMLFAVALAVAAIPEGLPAVLTLTLTLGVERMSKRRAVVRRLSAVESLGSVTVIATDKTGTLTENQMSVKAVETTNCDELIKAMALVNDADLAASAGDSLELGLLRFVAQSADVVQLRAKFPRVGSKPFDSSYRYMRVSVSDGDEVVSYLKGAPEEILSRSVMTEAERQEWNRKIESEASGGFRVLAFASGRGETEDNLKFLGIASLWDPPRPEVSDAILTARRAGIKVIMVTGDHPSTALAVACEIGIDAKGVIIGDDFSTMSNDELRKAAFDAGVLARVNPEHKLRLVEVLQSGGEVVAMTGDGVNDAPALKKADVGIAMGKRGSDVSREIADIVLTDDNFSSIIAAIEEGRNIYENIQKFIRFLFSTNMAFVLMVVFGTFGSFLMGLKEGSLILLPLTAVQILWVNIITDGLPALALGFDKNPAVMSQAPRPASQSLLDRRSVRFVVTTGVIKASVGGLILVGGWWREVEPMITRTTAFLFQSTAELFIAYPSRRITIAPLRNTILHASVLGGVTLQILTISFPPFRELLGLQNPGWKGIVLALAAALVVWIAAEIATRCSSARPNQDPSA